MFAKFGEILAMTFHDIKVTKLYRQTDIRTDNVKTVYPSTNTVCREYNNIDFVMSLRQLVILQKKHHIYNLSTNGYIYSNQFGTSSSYKTAP